MTPGLGSASGVGLSSFGILLTGRLELRNDLLSAISLGKDGVWDERYFVLTRKGLHYYVRQRTAEDLQGRDLFGQHEGSVSIRAMRKVVVSGDDDHRPLVFTIQTKGLGRDYTLRARSPELFQRWSSILTSAIDEVQNPPLLGSQDGRSQQGLVFASRSSSFPRVPPRSRTLVGPKAWAAPGVVWAQASGGADRAGAASAAPVRSCRCHRSSTSARRLQRQTT